MEKRLLSIETTAANVKQELGCPGRILESDIDQRHLMG